MPIPTHAPLHTAGWGGSRPWWRRIFHWPLFVFLSVVHLLVLVPLLDERLDADVALIAGLGYAVLAVLDVRASRHER